ncbi:hypothetical protein CKA27_18205 [Vibrio coralliilyticus]|nr:hypothetical protein CKA27_18205 [Vibrio coralliilyticus]
MKASALGALLIILSHGLNSLNKVWYADASAYVDPMVYALFGYGSAIVFFWLVDRRGTQDAWQHRRHWWNINVSSALTFGCFLYALKFADAVMVSAIESGLLVIFTLLLGRKDTPLTASDLGSGLAIFALTLASCYFGEGVETMNGLGVGLAVLTSLGVAFIIRHQKALADLGYAPQVIMKHRFYLITAAAAVSVAYHTGQWPIVAMGQVASVELVGIAFVGSALCLYLIQQGVARCPLHRSSALMASMPVVTFVVSQAYEGGPLNVPQLLAIVLLALALVRFASRRQAQRPRVNSAA